MYIGTPMPVCVAYLTHSELLCCCSHAGRIAYAIFVKIDSHSLVYVSILAVAIDLSIWLYEMF
jgi:hypothetical protein